MFNLNPTTWDLSDWGFAIFVAPIIAAVVALVLDWILAANGLPTISETFAKQRAAWKQGQAYYPSWGIVLIAGMAMSAVGLTIHLYSL